MKKWLLKIAAVFAAIITVFSFVGCNTALSAYEIAVKNGFVGTEAEWLASLKGKDGDDGKDLDINQMYAAAVADGYQGTMSDFLKEFFDVEVGANVDTSIVAHNVMSSVSIICVFEFNKEGTTEKTTTYGGGSGVIYHLEKENGRAYIVTNYHVVHAHGALGEGETAKDYFVYLYGAQNHFSSQTYTDTTGHPMKARFVGGSKTEDIAVLAVEDSEYLKNSAAEEVKIRESGVKLGEAVHAIGNAGGRGISIAQGVVSSESETIYLESLYDNTQAAAHRVIRTDAAINKGNSGGGMFDADGNLVGIVQAKSNSETMDNVGYAIPIQKVVRLVDEIIATGKVDKMMLGVTLSVKSSYAEIDAQGNLVVKETVYVVTAPTTATASAYGVLMQGDVIKKIAIGTKELTVTKVYEIGDFLILAKVGDVVEITFDREGTEYVRQITAQESHMVEL